VALVLFGFYPAPLLDLANSVVTGLHPTIAAAVAR
jgi:hypothetical protein